MIGGRSRAKRAALPAVLLTAALLGLSACAVGPDYVAPVPAPSAQGAFVEPAMRAATAATTTAPPAMPMPGATAATVTIAPPTTTAATATTAAPVDGAWWRLFQDPALDRLVADALAHNPDVRVAAANLAKARAIVSEARGARLPSTTTSAGYTRNRVGLGSITQPGAAASGATGGATHYDYDFYNAGIDASYEIDLFGRVSRSIEAARGDAAAAAADLDAARIAVAAETARSYANACASAAQAAVARDTARLQGRTLDLTRRLYQGGRGTQRDIDQADVLTAQAEAQVPGFEAERRAALYALAALTGRPPADLDADAARCATPPRVATPIPVGDGAALLARRPDVRAAERRLAAATARIGVATAALYPQISLGGSASLGATRLGDLGKSSSFNFSLGPLLSWSFPNISVARARVRQERAATAAALARFDGTVLTALAETEQALARLAGALDQDAALTRASASADNAARLSRIRFDAGRDNFLQLLDAERARATTRAARAQSQAAVTEAQVALFNALGGGWDAAPPVAEADTAR